MLLRLTDDARDRFDSKFGDDVTNEVAVSVIEVRFMTKRGKGAALCKWSSSRPKRTQPHVWQNHPIPLFRLTVSAGNEPSQSWFGP
jgi:hypothetical protein